MLRTLDLFSGIGGFSLGLERTGGFETVAFCEIEEYPRRVLAKHWPDVPIFDDVRELTGEQVGPIDVICGGFPCQDISFAGTGTGNDGPRSGLWSEYSRLISEIQPQYVIVENVAALLNRGLGRVFGDLATFGYDAEWHCIPAADVGAPHARERVWIIAHPRGVVGTFSIFTQDHVEEAARRGQAQWRKNRKFAKVAPVLNKVSSSGVDKPQINRVDDGFSDWPHRLASLGNAVVPQVVEMIGHAILEAELAN